MDQMISKNQQNLSYLTFVCEICDVFYNSTRQIFDTFIPKHSSSSAISSMGSAMASMIGRRSSMEVLKRRCLQRGRSSKEPLRSDGPRSMSVTNPGARVASSSTPTSSLTECFALPSFVEFVSFPTLECASSLAALLCQAPRTSSALSTGKKNLLS